MFPARHQQIFMNIFENFQNFLLTIKADSKFQCKGLLKGDWRCLQFIEGGSECRSSQWEMCQKCHVNTDRGLDTRATNQRRGMRGSDQSEASGEEGVSHPGSGVYRHWCTDRGGAPRVCTVHCTVLDTEHYCCLHPMAVLLWRSKLPLASSS